MPQPQVLQDQIPMAAKCQRQLTDDYGKQLALERGVGRFSQPAN